MDENLTERERLILTTVVATYLETGEPVSSAAVQTHKSLSVSSATIRNAMKRLEEIGFLEQPHTSAGRIPSAHALRVYVDSIQSRRSDEQFSLESETMRSAVTEAATLLSEKTNLAALAVGPTFDRSRVREITLVPLNERRILVIVVSERSEAFERIVNLDFAIERERLSQIQTILNAACDGKTVTELRKEMRRSLSEARAAYRKLAETASRIADQLAEEDQPDVVVEHSSNLFGFDELTGNVDRLRSLMMTLEEREQMVEILDALHASATASVYIGPELGDPLGNDLSLVVCGYFNEDEPAGLIGVLGPMRMDYVRLIPLVDQAARVLSNNKEEPS